MYNAMAAELGFVSLSQLQKFVQSQQNQNQPKPNSAGSCMWNHKQPQPQDADDDDDSWEVRAFAEDTANVMGTTWPPRSYTCTFCRREFRSAQALGGHMNVHRRDRARLHQTQPATASASLMNPTSSVSTTTTTTTTSSTLLTPARQIPQNGGLCLLYQLPNPNGVFGTSQPMMNACFIGTPSTSLSIPPYPYMNSMEASMASPLGLSNSSPRCYSTIAEPATTSADNNLNDGNENNTRSTIEVKETSIEELDLELRLGHRPTTS